MILDPKKTALLTLDFQNGIFGFVPGSDAIIPNASKAVEFARRTQFRIVHVGLGFSEGHPEGSVPIPVENLKAYSPEKA